MSKRLLATLVVAAAGAANACGYLLDWFDQLRSYDDFVHLLTAFAAGVLALVWLEERRTVTAALSLLGVGLLGGLAWEYVEFTFHFGGGVQDTLRDLLLDAAGASAGLRSEWPAGALFAGRTGAGITLSSRGRSESIVTVGQ